MRNLIAASVLFLAFPLLASTEGVGDKGFSIAPRASYFKPKDAEKGSWYAGAQLRLHPTPSLGLEGSVDYRKNEYAAGVEIKAYPVQATLLAYLMPHSPVSPFLLGGAGWYYTQLKVPFIAKRTDNRFGLHAGFGLEAMLTDSLSLDGSYRYIWLADVTARDTNAFDKKYRDSGSVATVALNFLF